MVIRLKCPSTIVVLILDSLLELRLSWNLGTLSVLSWVSWSHINNRLWKLLTWRTTDKLISCLMRIAHKLPSTCEQVIIAVVNSDIVLVPTDELPDAITLSVNKLFLGRVSILSTISRFLVNRNLKAISGNYLIRLVLVLNTSWSNVLNALWKLRAVLSNKLVLLAELILGIRPLECKGYIAMVNGNIMLIPSRFRCPNTHAVVRAELGLTLLIELIARINLVSCWNLKSISIKNSTVLITIRRCWSDSSQLKWKWSTVNRLELMILSVRVSLVCPTTDKVSVCVVYNDVTLIPSVIRRPNTVLVKILNLVCIVQRIS